MRIKYCWAPCIKTNNLPYGCKVIAYNTIGCSLIFIILVAMDMVGNRSMDTMDHLFDITNLENQRIAGGIFIFYLSVLFVTGILLIVGIKRSLRNFLLPWLTVFGGSILFDFCFGFWLFVRLFADDISDTQAYCQIMIIWGWMTYSAYLWLVVHTVYQQQSMNNDLLYADMCTTTILT